ncbi:ABC transporter permease [Caldicellulosiruptoraceae bacterium PP1]
MNKKFVNYLLQKLFWYLVAFYTAISLNFILPRLIPGNPVQLMVSQLSMSGNIQGEAIKKFYETYMREFGLDKPLLIQYIEYLKNILRFDLGTSFMLYPGKVIDLIKQALPWSLGLQIPAILLGWIIGNILGAFSAYEGKKVDDIVFTTSLVFSNIPYYCLAIILLYLFTVKWPILPSSGGFDFGIIPSFSLNYVASISKHYVLPFLSLVIVAIGGQAIGMRQMALYELTTDYIYYSRTLGLNDKKIIKYVFRNAMLPQVTGLALSFGTMMSGALVTENVFSYPGVGTLLFTAIRQLDYPLIQGCTLFITVAVLLANFLVEIAYGFIDPRIRAAQEGER